MADQRFQYSEEMVGAGHPTKPDTLNRFALVGHNIDGTQEGFAVSGTNTYAATIGITAYTDKQAFDLVFANASTAASTLNIDAVGAKKLYVEVNGVYTQVGSGDIFAGMHASITHDSSLDGAAGGFIVRNKRAPIFAYGTYAPTITNIANLDSSAGQTSQYLRVGNVVTVSGLFTADVTAAGSSSQLRMTLPIASNFTAANQCCGTFVSANAASICGAISADATNDQALFDWIQPSTPSNITYSFTFTYLIA